MAVASVGLTVATLAAAASLNLGFADTAKLDQSTNYSCGPYSLDPPCSQPAPVYADSDGRTPYNSTTYQYYRTANYDRCKASNDTSVQLHETNGPYDTLYWSNCNNAPTMVTYQYNYADKLVSGDEVCVPARTDGPIRTTDARERIATVSQVKEFQDGRC